MITVEAVGIGRDTADLNLYHVPSSQNICESVEVSTIGGSFTCQTKALTIQSTDEIKLAIGAMTYACGNTGSPAECTLTQELASSPSLSSVTLSAVDTITMTGANFPAGQDVSCSFKGVEGTATLSGNTVTCVFAKGVPASDAAEVAIVTFTDSVSKVSLRADSNGQTLTNALGAVSGAASLECSFAGGCTYSISGTGLASALQSSDMNKVTVCENECVLDLASSDSSQASCTLPALATSYSANEYDLIKASNLAVQWTGTGSNPQALNDDVNTKDLSDTTSSGCFAEVSARPGYTFSIEEVKIFLNSLTNKTPYINGNLILQGSTDGASFSDIYSYDESIHEGWNSVDWRSSSPQVFKTIRLQGAVSGSCRLGEVKLIGVEVLDDSNTSTSCTAKLTLDGASQDLTAVTYSDANTSSLDA